MLMSLDTYVHVTATTMKVWSVSVMSDLPRSPFFAVHLPPQPGSRQQLMSFSTLRVGVKERNVLF